MLKVIFKVINYLYPVKSPNVSFEQLPGCICHILNFSSCFATVRVLKHVVITGLHSMFFNGGWLSK